MKAGWCDFRYIANRPQHFRPPHNKHRLVTPGAALRSKLGYEQYRKHMPERTELASENAPNEASKRPKMVLTDKIGYDQFRPDTAAPEDDTLPVEHAKTKQRTPSRAVHNHGLGANRDEIVANCEQFASRNILALSILFSVDPGLLAVVDASGSDPHRFNDQCADAFIPNVFSELGWGDTVEYAYVAHDKPDRLGRARLHNHMTLPGSVPDLETGKRRPLPYIRQTDIQRMQTIADRTVEQQLDLQLGREWRLQVPEYVHTYAELEPELPTNSVTHAAPIEEQIVPLPPPDLFLEVPPITPKRSTTADEAPPPLFTPTEESFAFDSFGDQELIARLVDDLFGAEMWQTPPSTAIVPSPEVTQVAPNRTDERAIEAPVDVPKMPVVDPPLDVQDRTLAPDLSIELTPYWIPELGLGLIVANVRWTDGDTGDAMATESPIYATSVMDQVYAAPNRVDFQSALVQTQRGLDSELRDLQSALAGDLDQGLVELYTAWFQTLALDDAAIRDGFLPEVPPELLPIDRYGVALGLTRLPDVRWVYDTATGMEYGFTMRMSEPEANGERLYSLESMRRWLDGSGVEQIDGIAFGAAAETLEMSVQTLRATSLQFEHDIASDPPTARQKWHTWFYPEPDAEIQDNQGLDSPDIAQNENELDEDEQPLELDNEWDME